jgi:hypothetical protein
MRDYSNLRGNAITIVKVFRKKCVSLAYFFFLDLFFEFVAGVKRDNPPCFNRDGLTGSGVSPRARGLGSDLKIPKSRNFHIAALNQILSDKIEKCIDHVLRFSFIESDLLK